LAPLRFGGVTWSFDRRPRLVAVVNVTPDSFSDGGRHKDVAAAVAFALRCVGAGAEVLDVGGESTRPSAGPSVSAQEEIDRVVPVIQALCKATDVPISVDTTKASVAAAAVSAGATIVNDISGGLFDPAVIDVAERTGVAYVLGHVRGRTLAEVHAAEAQPPTVAEVESELGARLAALPPSLGGRVILDSGLGFGKKGDENLALLAASRRFTQATGRPVMVGPSRKRFLGALTGRPIEARDDATVGACLAAAHFGAHFLRVHDVARVRDALVVFEAVFAQAPVAAGSVALADAEESGESER
jgi:dihydropteroate synthase